MEETNVIRMHLIGVGPDVNCNLAVNGAALEVFRRIVSMALCV